MNSEGTGAEHVRRPLLELRGVSAAYGPVPVLRDLNISLGEDEVVCLLGGNAAGKTSTMNTIVGMLPLQAGTIHYDGQQISGLSPPDIVSRGIASHEDVDLVVSGSFGRRLATAGPFQVFDIAGWDVITSLFSQLAPEIDSSTEAPAMLRQMVQSGDLGVKSGRGFYTWTPESASELRGRIARGLVEAERLSQATGPAP